jgi:hypothetical protein
MADDGPNVCVRCGLLYPELFMVPDHVWQHYIEPAQRDGIMFFGCWRRIVTPPIAANTRRSTPATMLPTGRSGAAIFRRCIAASACGGYSDARSRADGTRHDGAACAWTFWPAASTKLGGQRTASGARHLVQRLLRTALVDGAAAAGRLALRDVPSASASGAGEGGDRRPMTMRPIPTRHWRSYGDDPLPTGKEALNEPFRAVPSWFMRSTCDRCGKDRMLNEAHMRLRAT